MTTIGLPDAFIEHGAQPIIRAAAGLDVDSVVAQCLVLVGPAAELR